MVCVQEDFDNIMKEYPESSKAMDLIAEHRLRSLYASAAWQSKIDALADAKAAKSLGAKIEHVLEASPRCSASACSNVLPQHDQDCLPPLDPQLT